MDKEEKKAPAVAAAAAAAAAAEEVPSRSKRKYRDEDSEADDGGYGTGVLDIDHREPRGNLRRMNGAVESDSDVDDSPAALRCHNDMQALLTKELEQSFGSMHISIRPILKHEQKRTDTDFSACQVRFSDASDTVWTIPTRRIPLLVELIGRSDDTGDWRQFIFSYIYSLPRDVRERAVRRLLRGIDRALFKRAARYFPRPLSDDDEDPFCGYYLPLTDFEKRTGLREGKSDDDNDEKNAVDADVEYHEGEDDEDYDEAADGEGDDPDLGSGDEDNYTVEEYDAEEDRQIDAECKQLPSESESDDDNNNNDKREPERKQNLLSAFESPALCDSLHHLNLRFMAQFVLPWAREQAVEEKDRVMMTLLLIRTDLQQVRRQVLDGFTNYDQLNEARAHSKAWKEAKDDPRLQGNNRMFELAWLVHNDKEEDEDDSKAAALKALKRLKNAAQEVRTSNLLLQAVAQVTVGDLQDRLCRKFDGLRMTLTSAKNDLLRLRSLRADVLCCELQLALLRITRKGDSRSILEHEAYHPVLGTSRARVLALVMGTDPDKTARGAGAKLAQILGSDYVDDFTSESKQLTGQSLAFVLALGHQAVSERYTGVRFHANELCYFADSECVRIILQKKRERLAHVDRPAFVEKSNNTIEQMCGALNRMHSTCGAEAAVAASAAAAAPAQLWVQPEWITAAHGVTDADINRRLARLTRTLAVLGTIKHSVDTLFCAIDARYKPTSCSEELQERFSKLLLDPPIKNILSGAVDGAAAPDLSLYALAANSVGRKWAEKQEEKERQAARAEAQEEKDGGYVDEDEVFEAVHGDIVEAFPASFEVYHRRQRFMTKSDSAAQTLSLVQAAQRDERAYKRVKRVGSPMPAVAAAAVAAVPAASAAGAGAAVAEPEAMTVD